jgi:hypothetical protein
MAAEPGHPGGLLTLIVAAAAWIGADAITRDRPVRLAVTAGLAGAALALIKINVGAFFIVGAGAWMLLQSTDARLARLAPWLLALVLAVLLWGLMHALIAQSWVKTFAFVATCASLAALLASLPARRAWFSFGGWAWFGVTGIVLSGLVVAATLARGTSAADLLEGVLLGPARHPGVFFFAVNWRPGAAAIAAVSLALAAVVSGRRATEHAWFAPTVAVVRLLLLAWTVMALLGLNPLNSLALVMNYGLALTWLLVIPLSRDEAGLTASRVRSWLGLLVVLQALHAYPVGGSQIGWGTFLWIPLLVLAAAEGAALPSWWHGRLTRVLGPVAALVAFVFAGMHARIGWQYWRSSEPLRLPGAESLHLPEPLSASLRTVSLNASVHADTLFSLPGVFSFNLWTGRPTPTGANVTHWFSLLNPGQQRQIIDRLAADPRACIIVEHSLLTFLHEGAINPSGPLRDYLYEQFEPAFATGNYQFWVKRGRTIAPLGTASLLRHAQTGAYRLEITAMVPAGSSIARVEWLKPDGDSVDVCQVFDASNSRIEIAALFRNGSLTAAAPATSWSAPLPAIARIALQSDAALGALPQSSGVLRLRDAAGAVIGEAVFLKSPPSRHQ